MSNLTSKDIDQIATLARLSFSDDEKRRYAQQLSSVLGYIGSLNEVDTDRVEETCQVTGLIDIFREDVAIDCPKDRREKFIACFPERVGKLLKVKAVFGE